MTEQAYPGPGPAAIGLDRSLERSARSPFFRSRLERAGVSPRAELDWAAWRRIPPTTKEDLRALEDFEGELVVVPREKISEYWRSGGVTGRPLFYARSHGDVEWSTRAFAQPLRLVGVRAGETFMCSLPIGIHPAGQHLARAAESLGAATVWSGAGNQTPSATQVELVHGLGVTIWCGMASFGLHLAHLAESAGRPLETSEVHTLITTAEPLSRAKRELLERLWGAKVYDVFGMSEITLMGGECGRRPGLHILREYSFCEVLDPGTLEPVPPGEVGILCVTPLGGNEAIPFLRWLSGDVVRMEWGCDCEARESPRLIHAGRTLSFFKIKGVNVNHAEAEEALYRIPALKDFRVIVTADDRLVAEIEAADGKAEGVRSAVDSLFQNEFGVRADVQVLSRGTIARSVEGQLKAQRFVDQRSSQETVR